MDEHWIDWMGGNTRDRDEEVMIKIWETTQRNTLRTNQQTFKVIVDVIVIKLKQLSYSIFKSLCMVDE